MKKIIPLTVLMILLIIGSVILFAQNQNFRNEIGILNNKIADLEKQKLATPTPVAEKPPEGWKEYIDEEYKFRVWYPEEFTYKGMKGKVFTDKYASRENDKIDFYTNILSDAPLYLLTIYI